MAGPAHSGRWTERRGWLVAFLLAVTVHAGVYQQLTLAGHAVSRPDAPPVVTVSLVTRMAAPATPAPPPPAVAPAPPPEPAVALPQPRPQPVRSSRTVTPRQKPAVPVRRAPAPAAAPALAVASAEPTSPVQAAPASAPLELPRADAAYLKNPPPAYPRLLLRRGVEGSVLVRAQVQDDGRCSQVLIKESSGYRPFDDAALAAVKGWRFVPARQGGRTVVAWVDVPIEFRITRTQ
ncbi:MAG: energy transducer TonB [Pseudomonadota bacterium]